MCIWNDILSYCFFNINFNRLVWICKKNWDKGICYRCSVVYLIVGDVYGIRLSGWNYGYGDWILIWKKGFDYLRLYGWRWYW